MGWVFSPYRHDAVIDHAAHLDVLQVAVLDVGCQRARGTAVGARGHDQPPHCQSFGQQLGLHLQAHKHAGMTFLPQTQVSKLDIQDLTTALSSMMRGVTRQNKLIQNWSFKLSDEKHDNSQVAPDFCSPALNKVNTIFIYKDTGEHSPSEQPWPSH